MIGCGRMGGAMAGRWCQSQRVFAYDPQSVLPEGVERVARLSDFLDVEDLVIVLAIKPQAFDEVVPDLAPFGARRHLFLSVMAGITLERMQRALGGARRITRAMPSIASIVGAGITAIVAAEGIGEVEKARIGQLLDAMGDHLWLEFEEDLDLVTAISGSGPAYFYRMTEALSNAGTRAGLPPAIAAKLARAAFTGAAAFAAHDQRSIAELREQVTSPGGTTAAGLKQLNDEAALETLIDRVVMSAATRSRELAR